MMRQPNQPAPWWEWRGRGPAPVNEEEAGPNASMVDEEAGPNATTPVVLPEDEEEAGPNATTPVVLPEDEEEEAGPNATTPVVLLENEEEAGPNATIPVVLPEDEEEAGPNATTPVVPPEDEEEAGPNATITGDEEEANLNATTIVGRGAKSGVPTAALPLEDEEFPGANDISAVSAYETDDGFGGGMSRGGSSMDGSMQPFLDDAKGGAQKTPPVYADSSPTTYTRHLLPGLHSVDMDSSNQDFYSILLHQHCSPPAPYIALIDALLLLLHRATPTVSHGRHELYSQLLPTAPNCSLLLMIYSQLLPTAHGSLSTAHNCSLLTTANTSTQLLPTLLPLPLMILRPLRPTAPNAPSCFMIYVPNCSLTAVQCS
eukprot:gene4331-14442_t